MIKNICCIGAGYVGGPTMAVIALKCPNINITVVDQNSEKIKQWNGPLNHLPIYEPGLDVILKKTRNKNLFFSTDISASIKKSELIFIAVNTPTKTKGEGAGMAADLRFIEACAKEISKSSKSDKIIVEKSTVPIKTAEKIKQILTDENSKFNFEVLSNPEFLAEGTAINDMLNPDRVLIGSDSTKAGQKASNELVAIYNNWVPKNKILTTNVWSSELSKLASNAMLAQRVSSINSLSALCEKTGANIDELSSAIGMDHRIGEKFLRASVGFGGSCFQKDILNLVYLCKNYGLDEVAEFWHQVIKINDYQKDRFVRKIISVSQEYGTSIGILGWAFKARTNDSRESASIYISSKLINENFKISVYDPMVKKTQILDDLKNSKELLNTNYLKHTKIADSMDSLYKSSNIILINTEWQEFKDFEWLHDEKKFIIDGRNILTDRGLRNYFSL
tara:strand:+ start:871 stop:2217 length:1347 start_codon:yes stop_codon:yes gene_type:complete